MKTKIALGLLSAYSLSLSLLVAVEVAKRGGVRYLMEHFGFAAHRHVPADWQHDWIRSYRALPNTESEIVFAGDSITATMPWADYYSDIRNRGIPDDTSAGLLDRVAEIAESRPRQVFVNIGTNDLTKGVPPGEVAGNIRRIAGEIHARSRSTEVFVVPPLPINLDIDRSTRAERKSRDLQELGAILREGAPGADFQVVDISESFKDEKGFLQAELTRDGLHLNDAGKKAYCEALRRHVESRELRALREPGTRVAGGPASR